MGIRASLTIYGKNGTWIILGGTRKIRLCFSIFDGVNSVLPTLASVGKSSRKQIHCR